MGSLRPTWHRDPNTLSNYDQFLTTHTTANLTIDFEHNVLFGNVLLDVKPLVNPKENDLILDASFLDIQDVIVNGISSQWNLLPRAEPYGNALQISLNRIYEAADWLKVEVSLWNMRVYCSDLDFLDQIAYNQRMHCTLMAYAHSNFK